MEKERNTNTAMATAKPEGMCEKLFNVLNTNPSFRPLRRLTFSQQNPETQPEIIDSNHKTPSPTQPKPSYEKPKFPSKTSPNNNMNAKRPEKETPTLAPPKGHEKTAPTPVPSKGHEIGLPIPVPPKGAMFPTPSTTVSAPEIVGGKPKKGINDKVEDYINRTKNKLRSTTLARTKTTK